MEKVTGGILLHPMFAFKCIKLIIKLMYLNLLGYLIGKPQSMTPFVQLACSDLGKPSNV